MRTFYTHRAPASLATLLAAGAILFAAPALASGPRASSATPALLQGDALHTLHDASHVASKADAPKAARASSKAIVLRGRFLNNNSNPQTLVVEPRKNTLALYLGATRMARTSGVELIDAKTRKKLGIKRAVSPVSVVKDKTVQVFVWSQRRTTTGRTFHATLYKVIGRSFAPVFTHKIGHQRGDASPVRTARIEAAGDNELLVTPIRRGTPDVTAQRTVSWNVWGGRFRAWEPIPTAPDVTTSKGNTPGKS